MNATVVSQQGNKLQIKFDITHTYETKTLSLTSAEYHCGAVYFQVEVMTSRTSANGDSYVDYQAIIFVRFLKLFANDNLAYTCSFSSIALKLKDLKMSRDNTWHKAFVYNKCNTSSNQTFTYSFDASFVSDLVTGVGPLVSLYEDTNTTDFELCGDGGSVKVHKLVLKTSGPVLQSMLNGKWKETSEGQITVSNATKETLEHFKDYIYLDKLPSAAIDIKQLLLIGSYFMMPNLALKCIVKLLNNVNADNILDLIEFAAKFKVTNMLVTLLRIIREKIVNIDHIPEDQLIDMCEQTNRTLNIKNN